jgi:hypothetical protein
MIFDTAIDLGPQAKSKRLCAIFPGMAGHRAEVTGGSCTRAAADPHHACAHHTMASEQSPLRFNLPAPHPSINDHLYPLVFELLYLQILPQTQSHSIKLRLVRLSL